MLMLLWNPLRRWWAAGDGRAVPVVAHDSFRTPAVVRRRAVAYRPSPALRSGGRPVTPFGAPAVAVPVPVAGAQQAARRFWMTLDPEDRRRGAIGGSFAEVCAALDRLASLEEKRPH